MTISLPVPWNVSGLLQFGELTLQLLALAALILIPMFFLFVVIYGYFVVRPQQEYAEWRRERLEKETATEKEALRIWRDCSLVYLQRLADGLTPHLGYGERANIARPITKFTSAPD